MCVYFACVFCVNSCDIDSSLFIANPHYCTQLDTRLEQFGVLLPIFNKMLKICRGATFGHAQFCDNAERV